MFELSLSKLISELRDKILEKEEILRNLPNQNHEFLQNNYPYTINPGGPNHEELVSLIGVYEYFDKLYNHHFENNNIAINNKIK